MEITVVKFSQFVLQMEQYKRWFTDKILITASSLSAVTSIDYWLHKTTISYRDG